MTRYARYDPAASQPAPVLGWCDPAVIRYRDVPTDAALARMSEADRPKALAGLLPLTDAEWAARMKGRWAVAGVRLVPIAAAAPAEPTIADLAAKALRAGVEVVSASSPGLSGTYPLDPSSVSLLVTLASYVAMFGALPAGLEAYPIRDTVGGHRYASAAAIRNLARAVVDRAAGIAAVAAAGRGTIPSGTVAIP